MKSWALVCLFVSAVGFSTISQAQTSDRITTSLYGGQMVALKGNVHGLAKPQFDLGRADTSRLIEGISLVFHPSASQQQDLDNFLKQLGDPNSPNYHKYLTPRQFGARFGLSQNDIDTTTAWLVSQGFSNIKVANNRNQISFAGTVGQIEAAFSVEMHNYLVNGVTHLANAGAPSVPAALAGSMLQVTHLNDFAPKPRAKVKANLTSYVSGNHFLSPADFATIYDLQPLYSGGFDGSGQKIAIVGQSTVSATDLSNFRSVAGLPASTVTMTLMEGTATRCAGDEGESDLDLEWSGGVAKNAQIIFVYAGLGTGDTCTKRTNSVWDALQYAVDNKTAPFISTSYGYCESGLGSAFAGPNGTLEGWTKQAISQGQTITSASGDAGAADCDSGTSATQGLAVDAPASLPEVTGTGGNEFTGDAAACPSAGCSGNTAPADPPYWSGSGNGSDTVSSALIYIPEMAWNDTTLDLQNGGGLSASGGGASIYYSKPTWQVGTGVPADSKRDVPDVSVTASADHDGYLVCSEDNDATSCYNGTSFRDKPVPPATVGNFTIVGGTSAAAPTTAAILAIVNQYLGTAGLAPINQTLYTLPGNSPSPFHDVTTGNNVVPCTAGSTGCPASGQYGFSAGVGYDQVTGLGSIDADNFAVVMKRAPTTTTVSASVPNATYGASVTFTATVVPSTATGSVNFYNNGSGTALGSGTLASGTASLSSTALPAGSNSVVAVYGGDSSNRLSTAATPAIVTVSGTPFTLAPSSSSISVAAGNPGSVTITVTPTGGTLAQTLTFSCPNLATGLSCAFSPNGTTQTSIVLSIATAASLSPATIPVTVSATGAGVTSTTTFTLNLTATNQSFKLAPNATSFQVTAGGSATANITLTGANGFNSQVTYTCTDPAPESACTGPVGAVSSSSPASFTITTTAPTARLHTPSERGREIFFATLFPSMLGVFFTVGSIRRRGVRFLGLILMLGFATLWIASCGGSSGSTTKNAGTPAGPYTITVKATTGGASPITGQTTFTLNVQ